MSCHKGIYNNVDGRMTKSDSHTQVAIEIKNPGKYMTLTYAISLSIIAILSGIVHLVLDQVIEQQSQTGKIVNVSGQQRMLSQRAALFSMHYVATGTLESKHTAELALDKMLENQQFLLADHYQNPQSWFSNELRTLYFGEPHQVERSVIQYGEVIREILALDYSQNLQNAADQQAYMIELAKTSLLEGLHTVVGQYEKESLEKVDDLRFAQNVVFWIIIFTILIEALFIFRPMVAKISQFAHKLQREANYDPLSSVYNRRAFNVFAKQSFGLASRHNQDLSIVMCDIDKFKSVNDLYGHGVGDDVIKLVAKTLRESIRDTDILARYGGEEFVILLPQTGSDAALVAEKIRKNVEALHIKSHGKELQITISLGVSALYPQDKDIEVIIGRADNALYQAKHKGRNQVRSFEQVTS